MGCRRPGAVVPPGITGDGSMEVSAMSDATTRRGFLGRGAGVLVLGSLAATGRWARGQGPATSTGSMIDKAVAFLKARQDPNGGWSTARNEPGITALAVAALLRSG